MLGRETAKAIIIVAQIYLVRFPPIFILSVWLCYWVNIISFFSALMQTILFVIISLDCSGVMPLDTVQIGIRM